MARGFESKSVESQQEDRANRTKTQAVSKEDAQRADARRTVELSLARARSDLAAATRPAHRAALEAAIATLEKQLQQ